MKPDVICGVAAVSALFARRPADAMRLFHLETLRPVVGPWCAVLAAARKPYRIVPAEQLAKIAGTAHHGGIAVVTKPRFVPDFDAALLPRSGLVLVLDGVGNPHNLGAIARSAAFFGVSALVIGDGGALPSDAAYRTSEGGLEWLEVMRARNLPAALAALDPHYRTVAATLSERALPLDALPRDRPLALVLGAEEHGISSPVLSACRHQVRIDGSGRLQSLNVAQAAAVLLHTLAARAGA